MSEKADYSIGYFFDRFVLIAAFVTGMVAFGIGAHNWDQCNNATPLWMACVGVCMISTSLFVDFRMDNDPVVIALTATNAEVENRANFGLRYTDIIVFLFYCSVTIWGSQLVFDRDSSKCNNDVNNYAILIFIVSWIIIVLLAVLIYQHLKSKYKEYTQVEGSQNQVRIGFIRNTLKMLGVKQKSTSSPMPAFMIHSNRQTPQFDLPNTHSPPVVFKMNENANALYSD